MTGPAVAAALSEAARSYDALDDVLDHVVAQLGGAPDLLLLFVAPHHGPRRAGLAERAARRFPAAIISGTEAGGVLAGGREVEGRAAIAAWGARLPGVTLQPFHVDRTMLGAPPEATQALEEALAHTDVGAVLVFSDPYSFDLGPFLPAFSAVCPDIPVIGAQASGAKQPHGHSLFHRGRTTHGGLAGVALGRGVRIDARVAQGCRPVGPLLAVTAHEGSLILELDGRAPVDVVRDLFDQLEPDDQTRFRNQQLIGLHVGDAADPVHGDFLIRHVLGVPSDGRGLAIAGSVETEARVQFHVRDSHAAHAALVGQLADVKPPIGALLFTCMGRGRGLFGEPNHDSRVVLDEVGPVPLAGFFGNGEVGPLDHQAQLHGYSSVLALLYPGSEG